VAWILICKRCKFGEKIYNNSRDIEFFLEDYFFWRALYVPATKICHNTHTHFVLLGGIAESDPAYCNMLP